MQAQPDSNRFSSNIYAPLEKWEDNFGVDRGVVMQFLVANHDYMIERQLPPNRSEPMYALLKANFNYPSVTTWEIVGVFDSATELVAMIKIMT